MAAKGQIDPSIRDECGQIIPWKKRHRDASNAWRRRHRAAGKEKKPTTEQVKVWQATHKAKHPRGQKNRYLKYKYGIDIDEFDRMFDEQHGKCGICGQLFSEDLIPYVDHEHTEDGHVRGLLCLQCNTGLGNFRDSKYILAWAVEYLEKHNG